MNTVVSFFDEREQILSLSKYIDSLHSEESQSSGKLFDTCSELLNKEDSRTAVKKIIENSSILFEKSNDKDIESFFLLIVPLISSKGYDLELKDDLIRVITNTSNGKDDKFTRLSILHQYYNYSQNAEIKTSIYISILDYAIKTQQNEKVLNLFVDNEKIIGELKPSLDNQRVIYSLLYKLVAHHNLHHSKVFKTNFLQTFTNENETSQWKDEIQSVIVSLINDPTIFQYETFLDTQGAKSLNQTPIFQLLDIFTYKRYSDFSDFVSTNKAELENSGIDVSAADTKMKLLTLLSLANENQVINISDAAKELNVSSDEVEEWVVNAISYGILDARIDELENIIYINYSIQREFTMNHWKNLHKRLTNWKDNVDRILEGLTQTEEQTQ